MKNYSEKLIAAKDVAKILGVTERTIKQLEKKLLLPSPLTVGGGIKRWRHTDITSWIAWDCPVRDEFDNLQLLFFQRCASCNGMQREVQMTEELHE